jgi:hypothetical protein
MALSPSSTSLPPLYHLMPSHAIIMPSMGGVVFTAYIVFLFFLLMPKQHCYAGNGHQHPATLLIPIDLFLIRFGGGVQYLVPKWLIFLDVCGEWFPLPAQFFSSLAPCKFQSMGIYDFQHQPPPPCTHNAGNKYPAHFANSKQWSRDSTYTSAPPARSNAAVQRGQNVH